MPFFELLFAALNQGDVRYVVAGGVATVLHGFARLTADVDLISSTSRPSKRYAERKSPTMAHEIAPKEPASSYGSWENNRAAKLTLALMATPAQRLAWLEEMIVLAHRVGALPKPRP